MRAGAAIVALNAALRLARAAAPAPDRRLQPHRPHRAGARRIEALGWTGGEAISDGRALLHYTRTTRDGRILFGWAGGRMACGARTTGAWRSTPRSSSRRAPTSCASSRTAGRAVAHAWGGPIDVSPTHLPTIAALPGGRAWAAFGYTGNGVGPSHLLGRAMAELATGRDPNLALLDPSRPPCRPSRCA